MDKSITEVKLNCVHVFRLVFEQIRLLYVHVYQKFTPTHRSYLKGTNNFKVYFTAVLTNVTKYIQIGPVHA